MQLCWTIPRAEQSHDGRGQAVGEGEHQVDDPQTIQVVISDTYNMFREGVKKLDFWERKHIQHALKKTFFI